VIPSYNHARYLIDAISSVEKQSFRDFEIIVVDDGSTDETPSIVPRNKPQISYIRQENQGLSAARNTGIVSARGEIIALLDADDLYETEFLAATTELLSNQAKASAAYCGYRFVDGSNRLLPHFSTRTVPPDDLYQTLLKGNFIVPSCMVARRICYEQSGGFDTSLRACEDWDMWLYFAKRFRVEGIDRPLVRYRVVTESMWSKPAQMLHSRKEVINKHLPLDDECCSEIRAAAWAEAYLRAAVDYLQQGETGRAFESFSKMAEHSPPLLNSVRAYYELACGVQPRGFSGDPDSLDLSRSEKTILSILDYLYLHPQVPLTSYRLRAFSKANFALAKLAYAGCSLSAARKYLTRSLMNNPGIALSGEFWTILSRSFLGKKLIRKLRKSTASTAH
jgi:hypothetical protein